jgi:hypothetical protein
VLNHVCSSGVAVIGIGCVVRPARLVDHVHAKATTQEDVLKAVAAIRRGSQVFEN